MVFQKILYITLVGLTLPPFFFTHTTNRLYGLGLLIPIAGILFYFFKKQRPLFLSSLFWLFFFLSLVSPLPSILAWPFFLLIPAGIQIGIQIYFGRKEKISWLQAGRSDRKTIILVIASVMISCVALVLWTILLNPDLSRFAARITDHPVPLIIFGIFGFAIINSGMEEIIFRGILWDGLTRIFESKKLVIIIQALLFGIIHYQGFPKGVTGMGMAFIFGIMTGMIRHFSKGMMYPVLSHFFADFTIGMILLRISGKI
ncbi:MAG: CPBP family intramembrane metalloprotease [Spirochaetes bacterium]|nr:CPBP family intramembrane metalloprotease [Spirochaetota bacterium]